MLPMLFSSDGEHVEQMQRLTDIVWPAIARRFEQIVRETSAPPQSPGLCWVVLEAAVLVEANWQVLCDKVVCPL